MIGSLTGGAGNKTRYNAGFFTYIRNEYNCKDAFYRLSCLAHQLDLLSKKLTMMLDDTGVFSLMTHLTEIIAYLRRHKNLQAQMGSKRPYHITV